MNEFDELVRRHLDLQGRVTRDPASVKQADIETLLFDTRAAGERVAAVEQREHLRAILRYWGAFLYEQSGEYPVTQLAPFRGAAAGDAELMGETSATTPGTNESWGTAVGRAAPPPRFLLWPILAGLLLLGAIALAFLYFSRTAPPSSGPNTGIPPEILDPGEENGESVVVDVTRPPETDSSGVDFILTVRPGTTLQALAAELETSVETLRALNPSLAELPVNGTLLALVGQPAADARLVVTTSSAAIYAQPDWQAAAVANMSSGSFARVLGRTSDYHWYWIDTGRGVGWLSSQDAGLIYPTVPDGLPLVARIQIIDGRSFDFQNDNEN